MNISEQKARKAIKKDNSKEANTIIDEEFNERKVMY